MEYETREIYIGNKKLIAEVADTPSKRAKGLSRREEMEKDAMLFIFDYESKHPVWMRGMKFPIDVIWLNNKKKIVGIKEQLKPSHFLDFSMHSPGDKTLYAIELPSGFIKKNRITRMSKVKI